MDRTHDDPRREQTRVSENQGWTVGPVTVKLWPVLLPTSILRWIDVYDLIVLMHEFMRIYGLLEADLGIWKTLPHETRPDVHLARASLKLYR